ncbi:MAG: SCP2 sterol-binding domain-containing protein [Candidatus Jordarchaeum sp.]|uniref:SCP2 sterol-binding domain-containing protein n=1 Tax=Candidatus Jordarchaeum sp. TaxID=2823881 RepID=UPI00404B9CD6
MVGFFTLEFFKNLAGDLNKNPSFESSMADFQGSMILKATDKGRMFYFEINNGKIENLKEAKEGDSADYVLEGPYDVWVRIGKAELMAREAIMSGQIKLEGSLMTLVSYADGFGVLLGTMASLPKEF